MRCRQGAHTVHTYITCLSLGPLLYSLSYSIKLSNIADRGWKEPRGNCPQVGGQRGSGHGPHWYAAISLPFFYMCFIRMCESRITYI